MQESSKIEKNLYFTDGRQVSSTSLTKFIEDTFAVKIKPCRWKKCNEIRNKLFDNCNNEDSKPKKSKKSMIRRDTFDLTNNQKEILPDWTIGDTSIISPSNKKNQSNCSIQVIDITDKTHSPKSLSTIEKLKPAIIRKPRSSLDGLSNKKVSFNSNIQVADVENWKSHNFDVRKTGYFCQKKGACGCIIF